MKASTMVLRSLAMLVLGLFVLVFACGPAAASDPNWVGVTQTLVVSTNPAGHVIDPSHVYTQISATGSTPATVKVPMSSSGLRNLRGFGTPPVIDGQAVWHLDLNGQANESTVANFPAAQLPLQVSVTYKLNGKPMRAKDILGKSGELSVHYDVKNVSTEPTTVTFKNAFGKKETRTVSAPVPFAALFLLTFPSSSFTKIHTPGGVIGASPTGGPVVSAEWILLLFNPLGGVHQSFGYRAHVTNAEVPAASIIGIPIPPVSVPALPTVGEPTAPSVPTYMLGGKLAALQSGVQAKLHDLASQASTVLTSLQRKAVPAAQRVATGSAQLSSGLKTLSNHAQTLSTAAADAAAARLQEAATAAELARGVKAAQARLDAFPPRAKGTAAFRALFRDVLKLKALTSAHAARLAAGAAQARLLQAKARAASIALAAQASLASGVSTRAAKAAVTIAGVTIGGPKERRKIHPRQIGGGSLVDKAVGTLDSDITKAGTTVDDKYSYLLALNKRAAEDQLLTGRATGAKAQYGYLVYSIAGVTHSAHQTKLATGIGVLFLLIGLGVGISVYRVRRGLPSSLKPPKSTPATAKG